MRGELYMESLVRCTNCCFYQFLVLSLDRAIANGGSVGLFVCLSVTLMSHA